MRARRFFLVLLAPTAAALGLLWGTDVPLGVPGEWVWSRLPSPAAPALTFGTLIFAGGCYLAFLGLGAGRIERSSPAGQFGWLLGLFVAGFAWLWAAQEAAPGGYQLSKAAWVLYFRGPSGYFAEARSDPRPLREILAGYEGRMREGDVLHIGTHPPGLVVFFRGLMGLCASSPGLSAAVAATQPASLRDSFTEIRRAHADRQLPITAADEAVLWLAALFANVLAAATVLPLYGLLRLDTPPRASWLATALCPAIPALAVFLPKSDAAFPCITALVLWLWLSGLASCSSWRAALAGFVFWLGLCLSLAFLPIGLIAAIATAWPVVRGRAGESRGFGRHSLRRPLAFAAAGFLLPCFAVWLWSGLDLPAVWWLNLRNHAGFYGQYPRTWGKWLLVNPLEFSIAAGIPLVAPALCGAVRRLGKGAAAAAPAIAFGCTWGLLWLSGKNMGEAARLWIFLTPCLIWLAAPMFEASAGLNDNAGPSGFSLRTSCLVLALQLIASAAIVTRIAGFEFQ